MSPFFCRKDLTMCALSKKRLRDGVSWASVVVALVLALLTATVYSQDRPKASEQEKSLLSDDTRVRGQAVDSILQERKQTISRLITLVDPANAKKYGDQTRAAAGFLLGELRAVEAVQVLSAALLDEPSKEIERLSPFDYPFWNALVKIGRPAVPAMIENIETSDHQMLRVKSLDVLNHVLGGKRHLLELLDKLKVLTAEDPGKRHRVEEAISWATEHYKEDKEPLY